MQQQPKRELKAGARNSAFATARRIVLTVLGFTVLFIGVLLLVLPGPAFVVIPIGLAILASEYAWARRYLERFKEGGEKITALLFKRKRSSDRPE